MFRNFFKTTLRNLWKNKSNSFLNIFGLAIGIACAGLIFLWVEDEMGFDKFNAKKDRLYNVRVNQKYDAYVLTHSSTPGVMGPAMKEEIPGIANTCRATEGETAVLFRVGEKSLYANGRYAESSVFSMFTLPFIHGNAASAFAERYSIVLTEKAAAKFFGDTKDAVGKTVRVDNKQDFVVSGVVQDLPSNSTLQFEWLMPYDIWFQQSPWAHEWGNSSISTYVELKTGASPETINKQLYNYIQKRVPASISHPFLFSMNDWHLYDQFENGQQTGGGRIEYVRLFSIIAWIILFIACINFMNLATARSEKRAREVGVRKVLGAGKKALIIQFIGEALFISGVASVLAAIFISLALPVFNTIVQKQLSLDLSKPLHILSLLIIPIITGLVAGSYPSLYLSSFNPVFVLKGIKMKTGSAAFIRRGLVVVQFTISIALITGTIIIYKQIQHVKGRNLGFNKENLLEVSIQGEAAYHFAAIKQDLLSAGVVENAALSDHTTLYAGNNTDALSWAGKTAGSKVLVSGRNVTPEFFGTTGLQVLEGRILQESDSVQTDGSSKDINVVITKSLAKLMGKESAIGKILFNEGDPTTKLTVVGVVNDYVYGNMYGTPDPVAFMWLPPKYASVMYVRTKAQAGTEKVLANIEAVLKKYNPAYPFNYRFVDDQFNNMFLSEMLISKLSRVFAALAIIISCLGLFGLAAYTAERRTKEIGVRKVLGASVSGLAGLLSKDFLKLVALSCLVAFPISWLAMNKWLQNYTYRIDISLWIFVAAGALAIVIALATVSFQAIKAAVANPVKSLRTE
ncbi:ABC transporter permease [Segetibacter aerophilus]|uniref:ABC transporter permease n=1 Tax=Segetibacter aerophilus TaxID=670293 RepID=A0A512BB63_9BACT|nr:ABC transporter permease [Segetibacter aerophilus]GEO09216.1 ABC transporter permease [Segetibacter aerophilus]